MLDEDRVYELSYSCALGYLGVLLRYHITNFVSEDVPQPTTATQETIVAMFELQKFLMPNIIGCFVMGMLIAWDRRGNNVSKRKFYGDFFTGLTTGFCGSLTTFASWLASFNSGLFRRYWLADIICIVIELCITWAFYCFGEYVYTVLILCWEIYSFEKSQHDEHAREIATPTTIPNVNIEMEDSSRAITCFEMTNTTNSVKLASSSVACRDAVESQLAVTIVHNRNSIETRIGRLTCLGVMISLAILWIIIIIDAKSSLEFSSYGRDALRSVAFSPFGVSLRYTLKRLETAYWRTTERNIFPWSTFICNLGGACISGGILFYSPNWDWSKPFVIGFLGSLTTVSALMKEMEELHCLRGIKGPLYAFIYTFLTFSTTIMCIQLIRLHGK